MRRFLCLVVLVNFTNAEPRISRVQRQQNDRNWDIRLAVPGEPGSDYPTLGNIPRTSFSCSGKDPGYYADVETNCQAFRVCTRGTTFGFQSFLCPNGTLFNQAVFVCDWWMNVNCDKTRELINNKTPEKFGNLQLGPQLMKDIKKMITFPMLNPYDKNLMKSNLIVMQSYVPPKGQMPMSAPLVDDFNGYYQQKQNIIQGFGNNEISFAASTPSSQYIPASNNRPQSPRNDAEVFQRPTQAAQYQINTQNTYNPRNNYAGKLVQSNTNNALPLSAPNSFQRNIQFTQSNDAQYVPPFSQKNNNNHFAQQLANPQQSSFMASGEFDMGYSMQYAPYPKFSPEIINGKGGNELKQNLELVYKILQDSLNVAKEYSNIAQQSVLTTKDTLQNVKDEDYARFTNQISQLTAQQYSGNNNFQGTIKTTPTYTEAQTQAQLNELRENFNIVPSQQTTQQNTFSVQSQNQIYSGQLYQLPVPDVTNQLNNVQQHFDENAGTESEVEHLQSFQNDNKGTSDYEIIQSQTVPLPAKLQQEEQEINEQEINTNALIQSLLNSGNGISAQVQDKIVGTIPHPSEHNKLVTYQNDKSYYVITHNNLIGQTSRPVNYQNAKLIQNSPEVVTYQLVPSVSYQLNDEKEQDNILNTFQIDQYGQPKSLNKSQRLTQNVNLEVEHPPPLYSGPSSYSAPQSSVGRLESRQKNNHVSRIEQFENSNNSDNAGYA